MSIHVAISSGDFNGIGPEVILKTLQSIPLKGITPVILSDLKVVNYYAQTLNLDLHLHKADDINNTQQETINILECYGDENPDIQPGAFTKQSGKCAMLAVEKAVELCNNGTVDAMVTAPISKEAVNLAGYKIPGHTEFLAEHTNTDDFMMMLVHEGLRVGLATVHIPVSQVPASLDEAVVGKYISIMSKTLTRDFNISQPRIAVLGLNPHAGDGGIIGTDEIDFIIPAIEKAKRDGLSVSGPFPADGFFGNRKYEQFDGVLAMYHDQGLIPFKTIAFGGGVNFTGGLPIIRTSPDHGTAFDIAGQNKADPSSFNEAFELAVELAKNRKSKVSG